MNSRKSILQCGIILYICVFLTGVPFVVSSFAKITKKPVEEKLQVITIKKGDTLWDLAEKWLNDPIRWPEFKKYNEYTNPDLIYPGEEMQIPVEMAEEIVKEGTKEISIRSSEIEAAIKKLQNSNQEISKTLKSQIEELGELKKAVNRLRRNINQKAGKKRVEKLEENAENIDEKLSNVGNAVERELQKSTKQVNQLNEKVDKIDQNVKAIGEKVEQLAAGGQEQVAKINQSIETLTNKVNQNQESISKLEKKVAESEGKVEKPSQGKKAFVVLTALAGGIAWFVVSSLSHSD